MTDVSKSSEYYEIQNLEDKNFHHKWGLANEFE